jgi:RNA polymerase sigma-70 factor (ECF subfamily)
MPSQTLNPASLTILETPATPFDDIDAVVALHQQRIFRFLLLSIRDADTAHSLTQDTFLRAWNARASFRNECSVASWLMRIAINLLRDHTRTERFRFWKRAAADALDVSDPSTYLPHNASSVESRLIASEQMALIWQTVSQLSPRQRTIFVLRFVEDMGLHEIAENTGLPISTVKSHLYRALAAIRARHNSSTDSSKEAL